MAWIRILSWADVGGVGQGRITTGGAGSRGAGGRRLGEVDELERVGQVEGGQDGALAGVVWERWAT
ncbi:MAG: hypothetical protein M3186_06385 [Actinomycetota bacterium]|nr:hypothetical protein [Actinomycetota bacterium]